MAITPPFLRTPYNYDTDKASKESGLHCKDPSLAQQHFAEECDINTIVERFHLTGEVPQLQQLPSFDDYEGVFDFQTAMNTIRSSQETFMSLPAKLRARFHNDPQEFLEFCSDQDNHDEARKLGLLKPATIEPTGNPAGPQGDTDEPTTERNARQATQTSTRPARTSAAAPKSDRKEKPGPEDAQDDR